MTAKSKQHCYKEKDYCFILQPKVDSQGSKIPFRDYRWIVPFVVQKTLSNNNYIVRRSNTKKTQILHHIRLKNFVANAPIENKHKEEVLQVDEEIVIPQVDLYTVSWEADFEYELFEPRVDNWPDAASRLPNDATNGGRDNYVTEDERCSTNGDKRRSDERNENDVIENEITPRPTSRQDATSPLNESPSGTEYENDVNNDLQSTEIASNGGANITVLGISENEKSEETAILEKALHNGNLQQKG